MNPALTEMGMTEEMKLRKEDAVGIKVKLGDGVEWIVPIQQQIPRKPVYSTDPKTGEITANVDYKNDIAKGLAYLSEIFLDGNIGDEKIVEWDEIFILLFNILKINYPDLTPKIANDINLFNTEMVDEFCYAVIGLKKN